MVEAVLAVLVYEPFTTGADRKEGNVGVPPTTMGQLSNGCSGDCKSPAFGHWGFESLLSHQMLGCR